jgi:hypothetical protein
MKKAQPSSAFFALKSPRLGVVCSGCKVSEIPNAGIKLDFPIVGQLFFRPPIPTKTLIKPETLEVYRLTTGKPAKLFAVINLEDVTSDKIPTAEVEEESSEALIAEEPAEEEEEAKQGEDEEGEEDEEDENDGAMPLAEKLRLLKQAEEAEGDSSISSSSGGYDSKDDEILGRDSSSSSESDSDVYEPDFQKSYDNAPEKFTVEIGVKAKFELTFVKNLEHKVFQISRVTVTTTRDAAPPPKKRKSKKDD